MKNYIKQNKKVISSIVLLVLTFIVGITSTFAWFISNGHSETGNINVETNNVNVEIRDIINIKRHLSDELISSKDYHKFSDGYYYEYNQTTGEYVLSGGNKIPMNITSIYPTEMIDITLWHRVVGEVDRSSFIIYLADFDDSQGKFNVTDNEGNIYEHSVRGAFRVGEIKDEMTYNWLGTFNSDTTGDTLSSSVEVMTKNYSDAAVETFDEIAYYKSSFRIELSLEQYTQKLTPITNALSEKMLKIGVIRLIV